MAITHRELVGSSCTATSEDSNYTLRERDTAIVRCQIATLKIQVKSHCIINLRYCCHDFHFRQIHLETNFP